MKISVIIPTYNRAGYLPQSLNSLVSQDYPQDMFEVLVVDDGSSDGTEQVIGQFTGKLNLKFFKEKHGGVCRARNAGIKNAQGDVLAFFDDDAIADKSWLKNMEKIMEHEFVVVGKGKPISNNIWQYFAPHYDRGDAPMALKSIWECNLAVRKEVFDKVGLFDENIDWGHEGNEFADRCIKNGYSVMYYPDMVIYHDYAFGLLNYLKKQKKFGEKLIYLRIGSIKKFSELFYNYKAIRGRGDGSVNKALESLTMPKKLIVKIIAKWGSWAHFYGSVTGYLKYRGSRAPK